MEKLNKIMKFKYMPYIIYMIALLILHTQYSCYSDDIGVMVKLQPTLKDEINNLSASYAGWSSRILINPLIFIMAHFDIHVWMILDVLFLTIIAILFTRLLFGIIDFESACITVLVMLIYPINICFEVGWMVTSMTYVWPSVFALLACMAIRKDMDGDRIRIFEGILYCMAIVYAANIEGLSVMLCIIYMSYLVGGIIRKRFNPVIFLQLILSVCGFMWHLLSTDNQDRMSGQEKVSFFDKIEIGFTNTAARLFFDPNYMIICFVVFLAICMWITGNKRKNTGVALAITVGVTQFMLGKIIPVILGKNYYPNAFFNYFLKKGSIADGKYNNIISWLFLLGCIIILGMIVVCIFSYFDTRQAVLILVILVAGFAARMVVSYAHGRWIYHQRTYYSVYLAVAAAMLAIYIQLGKENKRKIIMKFLTIAAVVGGLKSFCFIFFDI